MGDPKLTPALPRSAPKLTLAEKPAAKPAAAKAETPAGLSPKQKARIGGADGMTKTQAAFAPRPPIPPPSTEPKSLDLSGRAELATTCQVNAVSMRLQNSNDICGGASVIAALIFQSTSPEAARSNAGALRAAFNASSAKAGLPADVQSRISVALKSFEAGKLSEEDVCYLQQAAYAVGQGVPNEPSSGGLSTGAMASMVADLVGSGATLDSSTSFAQVFDGSMGHWVGASAGQSFNSAQFDTPAAQVDITKLTPGSREFSGRVRVLNDKSGAQIVQVQSRFGRSGNSGVSLPVKKGGGWQAEVIPGDPKLALQNGTNNARLGKSFREVSQLRD